MPLREKLSKGQQKAGIRSEKTQAKLCFIFGYITHGIISQAYQQY